MFGFYKKHKEAKRLISKGEDLLSKASYTKLAEWEINQFVDQATNLGDSCLKSNLPIDSALLYFQIFLLGMIVDNDKPTSVKSSDNLDILLKVILKRNHYDHKSQTVTKQIIKYYDALVEDY